MSNHIPILPESIHELFLKATDLSISTWEIVQMFKEHYFCSIYYYFTILSTVTKLLLCASQSTALATCCLLEYL